jgi:hypothetical protein
MHTLSVRHDSIEDARATTVFRSQAAQHSTNDEAGVKSRIFLYVYIRIGDRS